VRETKLTKQKSKEEQLGGGRQSSSRTFDRSAEKVMKNVYLQAQGAGYC